MEIVCPGCRSAVAADDVNAASGMAKCRVCTEVFRIARAPLESRAGAPPRGITLHEDGGGHALRYRWFSYRTALVSVWAVIWLGSLAGLAGMTRTHPLPAGGQLALVAAITFGIFMAYWNVAEWMNTTTFTIGGGRLTVRRGPIPWPGALDLPVGQVRQLYSQDRPMRQRSGMVSHNYSVNALLHDGSRRKIAANLNSRSQALYIEHCLERWMGIANEPVEGELAFGS